MMKRLKSYIPVLLCAFIFLGFLFTSSLIRESQRKELLRLNEEILKLDNDIAVLEAATKDEIDDVLQQASGLNSRRVEVDNKIASDFFETALTWSNSEEYEMQRSLLITTHNIDESSQLLQVFMPSGNDSLILNDLNGRFSFGGLTSYVTGISADNYTYFSEVSVVFVSNKGTSSKNTIIAIYTINSDGSILDIEVYTKI